MRRGPLYMIAAGLVFTVMLALVKSARAELSAFDVVFWRGLTAASLAYWLARGVSQRLPERRYALLALRTVLGFAAMSCSFTAAKGIGIADLSLIAKMQPLIIALLAPLVLGSGERSGLRVWLLMLVGMCGCVVLLAPDLAVGSVYGLLALAGASFAALAKLCVRALAPVTAARTLVFYFQAGAMALALVAIAVLEHRLPVLPAPGLWPVLAGIGVTATLGQLLMTRAYAHDRAPVVAAATYTVPLWGLIADLVVFSLVPDWSVIAGGIIIMTAGLLLVFAPGPTPALPDPDPALADP
ncbi:DMT family transporter [Haliangium sp.]|uniref:DMT family transporter n=1 Tax=Haliangium sp. TaxID=2663208 RepID=UPI003D0F9CBA